METSASAWARVSGKPSRIQPFRMQSISSTRLLINFAQLIGFNFYFCVSNSSYFQALETQITKREREITFSSISFLSSLRKLFGALSRALALVKSTASVFFANSRLNDFLPDAGGPITMIAGTLKNKNWILIKVYKFLLLYSYFNSWLPSMSFLMRSMRNCNGSSGLCMISLANKRLNKKPQKINIFG